VDGACGRLNPDEALCHSGQIATGGRNDGRSMAIGKIEPNQADRTEPAICQQFQIQNHSSDLRLTPCPLRCGPTRE
jgi:hypothetical protein